MKQNANLKSVAFTIFNNTFNNLFLFYAKFKKKKLVMKIQLHWNEMD